MKKESDRTDGKVLEVYNHNDHYTINNDKDKRYVKKMFEANNHLQPGSLIRNKKQSRSISKFTFSIPLLQVVVTILFIFKMEVNLIGLKRSMGQLL